VVGTLFFASTTNFLAQFDVKNDPAETTLIFEQASIGVGSVL